MFRPFYLFPSNIFYLFFPFIFIAVFYALNFEFKDFEFFIL